MGTALKRRYWKKKENNVMKNENADTKKQIFYLGKEFII